MEALTHISTNETHVPIYCLSYSIAKIFKLTEFHEKYLLTNKHILDLTIDNGIISTSIDSSIWKNISKFGINVTELNFDDALHMIENDKKMILAHVIAKNLTYSDVYSKIEIDSSKHFVLVEKMENNIILKDLLIPTYPPTKYEYHIKSLDVLGKAKYYIFDFKKKNLELIMIKYPNNLRTLVLNLLNKKSLNTHVFRIMFYKILFLRIHILDYKCRMELNNVNVSIYSSRYIDVFRNTIMNFCSENVSDLKKRNEIEKSIKLIENSLLMIRVLIAKEIMHKDKTESSLLRMQYHKFLDSYIRIIEIIEEMKI